MSRLVDGSIMIIEVESIFAKRSPEIVVTQPCCYGLSYIQKSQGYYFCFFSKEILIFKLRISSIYFYDIEIITGILHNLLVALIEYLVMLISKAERLPIL